MDRLGLGGVEPRDGGWSVGAATPLGVLRDAVPMPALQAATLEVGGPAVQNMATVGGNLFARAPFGDLAPALLALGARLVFASADGETVQPIEAFYDAWSDGTPPRAGLLTADRARRALRRRRLPEMRPAPLCEPLGGHGRRLGGEGRQRPGERCEDRAERRERASLPLRCGGAGGDRLRPGRGGGDGGRGGGRGWAVSPVTDPVATAWYRRRHGRRLRPSRACGSRLTARRGRQGWKPS